MTKDMKVVKKTSCHHKSSCSDRDREVINDAGKVVVKFDVGFSNALFIRGQGAGLSWEKGVPLKNVGACEWVWEPDHAFNECEFKVLINDQQYENGENHHIRYGDVIQYIPVF
ncbi:MAG: hypothetical protein FJZ57_07455 [Chlamydiae bacterium]|nr:hypothetical protein [Chlamydiota bacterium]